MDLYRVSVELTSVYEFTVPAKSKKEAVKVAQLMYGKGAVKTSEVWKLDPEMSDEAAEYQKLIGGV